MIKVCSSHGLREHVKRKDGYVYCVQCNRDAVKRRQKRVKEIIKLERGGVCELCGYSKCLQALEWHHLDPANKEFTLSKHGHGKSLAKVRKEIIKCLLLCANCHREVENGITKLGTVTQMDRVGAS